MPGPMRSAPILVRSGKSVSPEMMGASRYFQAILTDAPIIVSQSVSTLALTETIASDGMALTGDSSILIDSPGVYRFSYSLSFRVFAQGPVAHSNLIVRLDDDNLTTILAGGTKEAGSFRDAGLVVWGTVANTTLYRMQEGSPFTITLVVQTDNFSSDASVHRVAFTAERIAL